MFRIEVKSLDDKLTSIFEIVSIIFKQKSQGGSEGVI